MKKPQIIRLTTISLLFFFHFVSYSQTLKGVIIDESQIPVSFANITLKEKGIILAFTNSNKMGAFVLPLVEHKDHLILEINCLGFQKYTLPLLNTDSLIKVTLLRTENQLKTVIVKGRKPYLKINGDTLSYNAKDFISDRDRTISEVISRIPGIEISTDGKISYNGKGISNFYIDGDNLLDDKYNIATRSIPANVLDKVQILENHQPIKILRNNVVNENVAMNIIIKEDAKLKLIGNEDLGAGLPEKYYINLNAIKLNKKIKSINYLKANNASVDLSSDLIAHNSKSNPNKLDFDNQSPMLSLGLPGVPNLPKNRYLNNQTGLFNYNTLINFKNAKQFRINLSYLQDFQRKNYSDQTVFYLPQDTIRYDEGQNSKTHNSDLHALFELNINRSNFYLSNILKFNYSRSKSNADTKTNNTIFNQILQNKTTEISNEFKIIKATKSNNIIDFYNFTSYYLQPERLNIMPGINAEYFNNSHPYDELNQKVETPSFISESYLAYKLVQSLIKQNYKLGGSIQQQKLLSDLQIMKDNISNEPALGNTYNNLYWNKIKFYAEADYDVQFKNIKTHLAMPLEFFRIKYSDSKLNLNTRINRVFPNPSLLFRYDLNDTQGLVLNYSLNNRMGSINDVYKGYVLTNYRSLNANDAPLTEYNTNSATLGYNYKKPVSLFFFSVSTNFSHSAINNISSSVLNNIFIQRTVLPYSNAIDSWNFNGRISKYIFDIHSTVSYGFNMQISKNREIQNGEILPNKTFAPTHYISFESIILQNLSLSYNLGYLTVKSILSQKDTDLTTQFNQLTQKISVKYSPTSLLTFGVISDQYNATQKESAKLAYNFTDISVTYKLEKTKINLELGINNIFDVKDFSSLSINTNSYKHSNYQLPGRMGIMKINFIL